MSQLLKFFTILCFVIAANGFRSKVFERRVLDENREIRLCTTRQVELDKCNDLKQLLLKNKYEYKLECCLNTVDVCIEKVKEGKCDFVILEYQDEILATNVGLRPYLYEDYGENSYIVAVADRDVSVDAIKTNLLDFDENDVRSVRAALFFDMIRQDKNMCDMILPFRYNILNPANKFIDQNVRIVPNPVDVIREQKNVVIANRDEVRDENMQDNRMVQSIRFLRSNQLNDYNLKDKVLVCPDFELRDLSSYEKCNFDTGSVRAIYGRNVDDDRLYFINYFKQIVKVLNERSRSQAVTQLKLFGGYRGSRDVLFDNDVAEFSLARKIENDFDESRLNKLFCISDRDLERQMLRIERPDQRDQSNDIVQNVNNDEELFNSNVNRQFMNKRTNQPRLDIYRLYLLTNSQRPTLTRQNLLINDADPQKVNSNIYNQLLNEEVRRMVNDDVENLRRTELDMDRQNMLYNLYNPYDQLLNVDRSNRLSAGDRFRQILNLNRYQQFASNQIPDRQFLNDDQEQLIRNINRNLNINRVRNLYGNSLLDEYLLRQLQNIERNRQFVNENQLLQEQNVNSVQNNDRQIYDVDRNRQLLNDVNRDQIRQIENVNRLRDVDRQIYDVDRNRQLLNDVNRYQIRQIQNVNRMRNVDRQLYDVDRNRQVFDDINRLQRNSQLNERDRQNSPFSVLDVDQENVSYDLYNPYKQLLNVDRSRRYSNGDRFRQMLNLNQYEQLLVDPNFNREFLNVNEEQLIRNRNRYPEIDRDRMLYDAQLLNEYQMRELQDIEQNRQPLERNQLVQDGNNRMRNVVRPFYNVDRSRQLSYDINRSRQLLNNERQAQNTYQLRNSDRQLYDNANRQQQIVDEDQDRQSRNVNLFQNAERQLYDINRNRRLLNEDAFAQVQAVNYPRNYNPQLFDINRNRQYSDEEEFIKTQNNKLRDLDRQLYEDKRAVQNMDENQLRDEQYTNRFHDVNRYNQIYDDRDNQVSNRQLQVNDDFIRSENQESERNRLLNIVNQRNQILDENRYRTILNNNRFRDVNRDQEIYNNEQISAALNDDQIPQIRNINQLRDIDDYRRLSDVDRNQILNEDQIRRIQVANRDENQIRQNNQDRVRYDMDRVIRDDINENFYRNRDDEREQEVEERRQESMRRDHRRRGERRGDRRLH